MFVLEFLGGFFYLKHKIDLYLSKKTKWKRVNYFAKALRKCYYTKNKGYTANELLRIYAWESYLIGLIPWVIIFVLDGNYIAAGVEAGGAPSMTLGLLLALQGKSPTTKRLDYFAIILTIVFTVFAGYYSYNQYDGFYLLNQYLELIIVIGYLVGAYLLANEHHLGWIFFMMMNASNIWLQYNEDRPFLVLMQCLSLTVVTLGFFTAKEKN